MREKLIELLERFRISIMFGEVEVMRWTIPTPDILTAIVDYLIAHGVTVSDGSTVGDGRSDLSVQPRSTDGEGLSKADEDVGHRNKWAMKVTPAADAVIIPDKELRRAVNLLIKQYEHSMNSEYVHNPVAHALYHTWKQVDEGRE